MAQPRLRIHCRRQARALVFIQIKEYDLPANGWEETTLSTEKMNSPADGLLGKPGADRRANPRKPLRTAAMLTALGRQVPARTLDISKEGLGLTSDLNVPVGTKCTVAFSLLVGTRGHPVQLNALAVDTVMSGFDGFRIGMALLSVSADDRRLIEQYLAG